MLLDSGAVYYGFIDFDTPGTLLGATRGGTSFEIKQTFLDMGYDGAKGPVVGSRLLIESAVSLSMELINFNSSFSDVFITLASTPYNPALPDHTEIMRSYNDYIFHAPNIAVVANTAKDGAPAAFIIYNAISEKGISLKMTDRDESVIRIEFTGHYSGDTLASEPWKIIYPRTL